MQKDKVNRDILMKIKATFDNALLQREKGQSNRLNENDFASAFEGGDALFTAFASPQCLQHTPTLYSFLPLSVLATSDQSTSIKAPHTLLPLHRRLANRGRQ